MSNKITQKKRTSDKKWRKNTSSKESVQRGIIVHKNKVGVGKSCWVGGAWSWEMGSQWLPATHIDIVTQVGVGRLSAVHVELVHLVSETRYFCSGVARSHEVRDQVLQVVGEVLNNLISRCSNMSTYQPRNTKIFAILKTKLSHQYNTISKIAPFFDISFKFSTKKGVAILK